MFADFKTRFLVGSKFQVRLLGRYFDENLHEAHFKYRYYGPFAEKNSGCKKYRYYFCRQKTPTEIERNECKKSDF
jgi:hypothetical protein